MATLNSIGRYTGQRFFPALGHHDYRALWLAVVAGDSATWALMTARAWLAKTTAEEHGNTWVGVTIFAAMIPYVFVPPIAGLLADRMDRRNLLAWVFAFNLAHNSALTVLALSGAIDMWHLVFLSFLNGTARAVQTPAAFSLVANLVPRKDLINAYALNSVTFHGSRLLGPGLIAPIMATVEPGWVFLFCNAFFVAGILLVLRIRTASTGVVEPAKGVIYNLLAGLIYTYKHRVLLLIVVLIAFHCSLTMSFESLLPVLSDERFGSGGGGVAYLMMSVGAGALVASIALAGLRGEHLRGRLLFITGIISAFTPVALAVAPNLPVGALATAIMGASQTGFMVITLTMMQSVVPDAIRGRISSIYIMHAGGVMSFANLGNGSLADVFDPGWLLTIAGLAFLAVMTVSLLGPTMRRMYLVGVPAQASAT